MQHLGRVIFAGLASIAIIVAPTAGAAASTSGSVSTTASTQTTGQQEDSTTKVCGLDQVWLQTSIEGDRFEIKGGRIALNHSKNPAVRTLARTLISDHLKSLQESIDLAQKLGIPVPTEPSPTQKWQLEEISEMWGREFNHDYSELEVLDHRQDISEARDEVELGCNTEVRDEARSEIPVLQKHLALSKAALAANPTER
jgi:putative membrane protein